MVVNHIQVYPEIVRTQPRPQCRDSVDKRRNEERRYYSNALKCQNTRFCFTSNVSRQARNRSLEPLVLAAVGVTVKQAVRKRLESVQQRIAALRVLLAHGRSVSPGSLGREAEMWFVFGRGLRSLLVRPWVLRP